MILCVGEILADCYGKSVDGETVFTRKAGGAPFNLSCAVKKTGGEVFFVGSVGRDGFGEFLVKTAKTVLGEAFDIDRREDANTTLALVENDEYGERSFSFYRKNTADYKLPEISDDLINSSNIVHIGSLMLGEQEGLDYAIALSKRVKALGKKISFDVNYRSDVFESEERAKEVFRMMIEQADIVKFSDDEVQIFGKDYVDSLKDKLIFVTLGKNGSKFIFNGKETVVPSIAVKSVDTCGAGDAFYGACLKGLDEGKDLYETVRFANIVGALTTLKTGAIDALPTIEEVQKYL